MAFRNHPSSNRKYDSVRFENSELANLVKEYSPRVDLAYKECKEEDSFLPHVPDVKDDEVSKKHRQQGEIFFREEKYLEAIKSFTEALKTALSSLSIVNALIGRSAVLFRARLFRECLEDIYTADQYGIPLDKRLDVNLRMVQAEYLEPNQEKSCSVSPLLDELDNDIPGVSRAVEINKTCRKSDNHIVATRDINPGDVIAVEDPLIAICVENGILHCDHCMKITFSGVPCLGCTKAHYCSSDCLNAAYEQYHKEECKIVSMLQPYNVYGIIARMALAIRYNITETKAPPDMFISNRYSEILNLDVSSMNVYPEQANDLEKTAARIYHAIENYTNFVRKDHAEAEQACILKGLIMKLLLLRKILFKTKTVTKKLPSGKLVHKSKLEMCHALDIFYKYSCAPNVITVQNGLKRISRALDYIKQGDQLSISFECFYWDTPKEERIEKLPYKCECIACTENWPLLSDLPSCQDAKITPYIETIVKLINILKQKNKQYKYLVDKLYELVSLGLERNMREYALYACCLDKCLPNLHYVVDVMDFFFKYIKEEKNYI